VAFYILFRMDKRTGTVKWFSREKGWGFIRLQSGDEIFVHHSDIEGEGFVNLEDDEPVEFTVEEMDKGPRARHVRSLQRGGAPTSGDADSSDAAAPAQDRAPASAGASTPSSDTGGGEHSENSVRSGRSDRGSGGLRPLAEQLRERLGRHFPGLGG